MPRLEGGPFFLRIELIRADAPVVDAAMPVAKFMLRVEEKEHILKWTPDPSQELRIKARLGEPEHDE